MAKQEVEYFDLNGKSTMHGPKDRKARRRRVDKTLGRPAVEFIIRMTKRFIEASMKPKSLFLICLLIIFLVPTSIPAATLEVGSGKPYATIQSAIDAAAPGDTVLVYDGTYIENISFSDITVLSVNGPAHTIIDGAAITTVVSMGGSGTILDGFTIQNGNGFLYGGGVIAGTSHVISNCNIRQNVAVLEGGGIYSLGAPTLINCIISGNYSYAYGGGISCRGARLVNCTVSDNTAQCGGYGIYCITNMNTLTVTNSILLDRIYGGEYCGCPSCFPPSPCTVDISYSVGWQDGTGNIIADPLFVGDGDYHLLAGSPCIDAGTSDNALSTDMEGNPRYDDPNMPNTGGGQFPYYDIGAYEFQGGDYTPHAILGTVSGDVQAGVMMTLSGKSSGNTTTDSSGNYSFTLLNNGEYTVTPSMDGYIFTPASRQVVVRGTDETRVDFIAMDSKVSNAVFHGVWGSSATDIFAVGWDVEGEVILHYDGEVWSSMNSSPSSSLWGVWGSSAANVFALGNKDHRRRECGLIVHYDGKTWSPMRLPFLNAYPNQDLLGVWGSSGTDIFAVGGHYSLFSYPGYNLILHYDGKKWSFTESGDYHALISVWGSSATDVFAVGVNGTIIHYDGSNWSAMDSGTQYSLWGVWGSSGMDVFAVGEEGTIVHYDGTTWSLFDKIENGNMPIHNDLQAVWGISERDVYAAGDSGTILHYDGEAWSLMSDPAINKNLYGIWGSSPSDIFFVGEGTIFHYRR